MELTRREFLKLLGVTSGAVVAGTWGASTVFSVPDGVFQRTMTGPHIETWKNSICSLCAGGCGIRVRLIDGIPVRVNGNPLYPINRGAVCPMAEGGIEELFHPDRIRQPLKRTGSRGENKWAPISWDEALQTVAERLQKLLSAKTPEKFVLVARNGYDQTTALARRFMQAFGSPNFLNIDDGDWQALPAQVTHGFSRGPAYDFENSDYILNFGGDFLDEGPAPVRFNQMYAKLRSRSDGGKAQIIHISSYMSRTASNSTQWLPIKPGTMAALALGIAYVLIKDKSYNKDFINKKCSGFADWKDASGRTHKGFSTLVTESYYPEKVSTLTGVSASRIIEIARDFAAAKSALATGGPQAGASTNGLYTLWTIYCLNALKGNFEQEGGVLFPREMVEPALPAIKAAAKSGQKKLIPAGQARMSITQDAYEQLHLPLAEEKPYAIDTLFFYRTNPLFESTLQHKLREALHRVPFLVCCTAFMDETAAQADLILPDHVFLEKWEISQNIPGTEFLHLGIQQPMLEQPLYETRQLGDVILQLSKKLGGQMKASLPWEQYKDYLQAYARGVYQSGEGTIVSESVNLSWMQFLKKRGWQPFEYSTFEEFWDVLLDKGGWWDPVYPRGNDRRIFKTRSRKFEFYSTRLARDFRQFASGEDLARRLKLSENGDALYLPHFEPPRFEKENPEYPYHFLAYQILANMNGNGSHLSLIQELAGLQAREYWTSWVEINPETARKLRIHENDYVSVISQKGRLRAKVKILPTVMPEVIMMPFGNGHAPFGRFKKVFGANPHKIFAADTDLLSGLPSLISTKVKIEKTRKPEEV